MCGSESGRPRQQARHEAVQLGRQDRQLRSVLVGAEVALEFRDETRAAVRVHAGARELARHE
jgi:hypothetical protein